MNDIMKVVSETIKKKAKEQKEGFLRTVGASLFGNLLTGKCMIRAGEDTVRATSS